MAVQQRNSEMVELLSADFLNKKMPYSLIGSFGGIGALELNNVVGTTITILDGSVLGTIDVLNYAADVISSDNTSVSISGILVVSESVNLYNDGSSVLQLRLTAGGSVEIQRTAGTDEFDVQLRISWIVGYTLLSNTLTLIADKIQARLATGLFAESPLSVKAGSSTDYARVGGTLYVTTTQTGNITTGEDDLASYSIPANTLAVNGDSIWFEACGTTANNANVKTLRARFGTTGTNVLISRALTISVLGRWMMRGRVVRTGAATQKSYVSMAGSSDNIGDVGTALDQTLSGAVTLKVTGDATSTNDIVLESFTVGWDANNT